MKKYTLHQKSESMQGGVAQYHLVFVIYTNDEKTQYAQQMSFVTRDKAEYDYFEMGAEYSFVKQK